MSDLEYPSGLRYTAEHEWVRVDGDTDVQIEDEVTVDALLTQTSPQYARPVPTSTP